MGEFRSIPNFQVKHEQGHESGVLFPNEDKDNTAQTTCRNTPHARKQCIALIPFKVWTSLLSSFAISLLRATTSETDGPKAVVPYSRQHIFHPGVNAWVKVIFN